MIKRVTRTAHDIFTGSTNHPIAECCILAVLCMAVMIFFTQS